MLLQRTMTRCQRVELTPGITGISQVNGIDMSTPWDLAQSDARYGGDWSLREDIALLARTALGGGSGDAARTNSGR